jgi:chemotaxis methyl-accepting protein methylase
VSPLDYEFLRKLLKERSGLDLSADKQYLVDSRLAPLARKAGLSGITELVQKIRNGADPLTSEVVEAMTTNETFFLRGARQPPQPEDLVRGVFQRAGALFDRDVPEGIWGGAGGLAGRNPRHRPVAGRA